MVYTDYPRNVEGRAVTYVRKRNVPNWKSRAVNEDHPNPTAAEVGPSWGGGGKGCALDRRRRPNAGSKEQQRRSMLRDVNCEAGDDAVVVLVLSMVRVCWTLERDGPVG